MKEIEFNPDGGKIVINIEMLGLYFITYTYQLWAATIAEPPIVTNPPRSGSNENPLDDNFDIRSDYVPNEPPARNHNRVIDVRFWIKKVSDDHGYNLKVIVYQGAISPGNEIGADEIPGTVGGSIKEEFITIKLKSKTPIPV